jgi:hypothetical protein
MPVVRYSPARVTLGLSVAGAVFGAGAGATALAIASVFSQDFLLLGGFRGLVVVPMVIGAVLGAICAPVAGWWLLRDVPLGRMFLGLSLGTILGGVVGWFLPGFANPVVQPVVTAAVGFLASAFTLRLGRRSRSTQPAKSDIAA